MKTGRKPLSIFLYWLGVGCGKPGVHGGRGRCSTDSAMSNLKMSGYDVMTIANLLYPVVIARWQLCLTRPT
ncbi:hypothetical protein SAMN02744775_01748 [Enterobacter sp. CC120223-11]|nr:hypothetical protein SAMN02744775_01748 [Enterobacter sp. CC120223-11]